MLKSFLRFFYKIIIYKKDLTNEPEVVKGSLLKSLWYISIVLLGSIILLTLNKLNLTKKELVWIKVYYKNYDESLIFLTYRIECEENYYSQTKCIFVNGEIRLNKDNGLVIIDPDESNPVNIYWKDYGSISTRIMEV